MLFMLGECMSVHDCNCDHGLNIQQIDMNLYDRSRPLWLVLECITPLPPPPAYHFRRALPLTIEILKFRASS